MLVLTMKEQIRLEVIQRVMDGQIDGEKGATVLGRNIRTIYRLLSRVRKKGLEGIVHGNKGNKYASKIDVRVREKVKDMAIGKYKGFNDTHMAEKFRENEGIEISRETLRSILRMAGIKPKKKRRGRKYRSKRERKEAFGMMIQIDASIHDWLEGRGPPMTLVGGVDDATGEVWAHFEDSESTWGYLRLLRQIIMDKGVPLSLYSDRHTIFHSTKEMSIIDQLEGRQQPRTQFGRAMDELNIKLIKAYSPQAKGRVERAWGTFQDRLIAEMRLADIKTKEEANEFLPSFLKTYNLKFSKSPRNRESAFRKRPKFFDLDRILCLKKTRIVDNDHTIKFEGLQLQIPPSRKWASIAGQKVSVLQFKDGSIEIVYKNKAVARFKYESVIKIIKKCGFDKNHILLAA